MRKWNRVDPEYRPGIPWAECNELGKWRRSDPGCDQIDDGDGIRCEHVQRRVRDDGWMYRALARKGGSGDEGVVRVGPFVSALHRMSGAMKRVS